MRWIKKSAAPFIANAIGKRGYSYSWWTHQLQLKSGKKLNMFSANGWGGQYIMVFQELDAVIIFTGSSYVTKRPAFTILERYILPDCR